MSGKKGTQPKPAETKPKEAPKPVEKKPEEKPKAPAGKKK